ncbi:unnamed protein product [Camellia sinensis]
MCILLEMRVIEGSEFRSGASMELRNRFDLELRWSFETASMELRISESSMEISESSTELRNWFDLELRWSSEIASMEL